MCGTNPTGWSNPVLRLAIEADVGPQLSVFHGRWPHFALGCCETGPKSSLIPVPRQVNAFPHFRDKQAIT